MPAKRTTRTKGKATSRKTKSRRKSSSEFPCPNPDDPQGLEATIRRMQDDPEFALFIRDLLCHSYGPSAEAQAARDCLNSYYDPTTTELDTLCIPEGYRNALRGCTVPTKSALLAVPAEVIAGRYQ
jgi:hypothetical protein